MRYIIIVIISILLSGCSDKIYNTYQSDNTAYTKQIQAKYINTVNTYTLYIDSLSMPDMTAYTIIGSVTVSDTTSDTTLWGGGALVSTTSYSKQANVINQQYNNGMYEIVIDKVLSTRKGNIKALVARL